MSHLAPSLEVDLGVIVLLAAIPLAYVSPIGNIRIILDRVLSGVSNMASGSNNTFNKKN